MIIRLIIAFLQPERALTEKEIAIRFVILSVLLGIVLLLFVQVLRSLKKRHIRIITALILSAILIFEATGAIPFLQGEKQIPLEYVCSVETTRKAPLNESIEWYTNCSVCNSKPEPKESIEYVLACDLTGIDLNDEEYTYLFVLNYKDVDLFYSKWSEALPSTGNDDLKYVVWVGRLEATGEATDNTVYIFRFPRKAVVPYNGQWL